MPLSKAQELSNMTKTALAQKQSQALQDAKTIYDCIVMDCEELAKQGKFNVRYPFKRNGHHEQINFNDPVITWTIIDGGGMEANRTPVSEMVYRQLKQEGFTVTDYNGLEISWDKA